MAPVESGWLVPELLRTFATYPELGLLSLSRGLNCIPLDEPITRWEDLTDLVLTHMHFDHAGGATWRPPGSDEVVVRASAARIHLPRANWERAKAPGPRERPP